MSKKFELEYIKNGDYYIPNLTVPECKPIGKYGGLHCDYLKKNRPCKYTSLMITGMLMDYLHEVDVQAKIEIDAILKAAEKTAPDKSKDNLAWTAYMNNMKNAAEEIVFNELIYI